MSNPSFPTNQPAVVTCGLPYANGDLHIGHLRGYVSADVYNRALGLVGQKSIYVCGSDMHGTPIAVNAAKEGVSPAEFAMDYHEQYQETFPQFDVDFDNYGHTDDATNTELTRDIVRTLEDEGYVYEKEIKVAWDPTEDQPLPDRFVEGVCPHCGEHARGDECDEGCGRHLEPGEIEDPVSTITGNPAEYRDRTHKFFAVSELADYLESFLDDLDGTANAQNQPRQWIEEGLQDWCITRDMEWGIDYPDEEDLVLYVWVDAPIEYIASTKQYSERVGADEYDWEAVWKQSDESDEGGEIVHIIGRDIIQHHTIFWPAMLEVAGYNAPRAICATGFITIDGKGLSTSRNRAIWAQEYLETGLDTDYLRYYLTTNGGLQQDVDFSWEKFQERVNGELSDTLGNFLYRGLLFAHRNYGGAPDGTTSDEVQAAIEDAREDFEHAVNEYAIRDIGRAAIELAQFGNEYIQREEPWNLVDAEPDRAKQVIYDCVALSRAIAILAAPTLPTLATALWDQLGEDGSVGDATLEELDAPAPGEFGEPTALIEEIEDEQIDELEAELQAKIEAATEPDTDEEEEQTGDGDAGETPSDNADLEPIASERISFDTFESLDIRVGEIEAAEPIADADSLLRLQVDIGVETRQLVAGIREFYDVDTLPGTRVVVLTNLEKAEIFGVESNGMLLAAGEEADLLTTHGDAEPGTKIQ